MNNKSLAWLVLAVIVVAGAWYMWKGEGNMADETGPIRIGASLPLSGEVASFGEFTKAGIDLALKEINDAGGINGRMLEVVYEDDRCSEAGSTVFNKLVNIDNVDAIIGPVCSPAAGPGIPIAEKAKVPTIIWASAPGLAGLGDYIFRTYPSDAFQGKVGAEYVYNELGKRNVAVLYTKNDWGQGITDVFSKRFTELGGTIVAVESASQETTDLRTQLTKLRDANPDLIYLPLFTASATGAVKQAKDLGITVPFFGGDVLQVNEFLAVPESEGVMYTFGKLNEPEAFKARVLEVTGKESNVFSGLGYDSLKIMAKIMSEVGTDPEKVKKELEKLQYTEGVSLPLISFDEEGDLATAEVEVRVIRGGESVLLK